MHPVFGFASGGCTRVSPSSSMARIGCPPGLVRLVLRCLDRDDVLCLDAIAGMLNRETAEIRGVLAMLVRKGKVELLAPVGADAHPDDASETAVTAFYYRRVRRTDGHYDWQADIQTFLPPTRVHKMAMAGMALT